MEKFKGQSIEILASTQAEPKPWKETCASVYHIIHVDLEIKN